MTRSIPGRAMRAAPIDRDTDREDTRPEPRLERKRKGGMSVDQFYIPETMVPDGITYEWKRYSTINEQDAAYTVELLENHWKPVPAGRHKEFMPPGYEGNTITRGGLVLMERPAYLTEEARQEEAHYTQQQMRDKQAALGQTPRDTMERVSPKIARSYEPVSISDD